MRGTERGRRPEITGESEEDIHHTGASAHLLKSLRIGLGLFGSFCSPGGEKVASDDDKVGNELAGFRVGNEELGEGS